MSKASQKRQHPRPAAGVADGGPSKRAKRADGGREGARSPSWEPTSPSLLVSSGMGDDQMAVSAPSYLGAASASHQMPESYARSASSWWPTLPPLLDYLAATSNVSAPPLSHPPVSVDDRPADVRPPSWSPISPPLPPALLTQNGIQFPPGEDTRSPSWSPISPPLPTQNGIQFPPQEDTRSPSWSPASPPPLSTLYWRDAKTDAMTVLTSSYSPPRPAYHNTNTIPPPPPPSLSFSPNDDNYHYYNYYSPASPAQQSREPDSIRPKEEKAAAEVEDSICTAPSSFTYASPSQQQALPAPTERYRVSDPLHHRAQTLHPYRIFRRD